MSWWNVLRRCVTDDGEMIIAFDTAQQIYPRTDWNADTLPGAGFAGKWIELGGSRRLPNRMLPVLRRFAERFHPKALESLPDESTSADCPCEVRWIQETPETASPLALRSWQGSSNATLCRSPRPCLTSHCCVIAKKTASGYNFSPNSALRSPTPVKRDKTLERTAKQNFTMRTPRVKICTFQSFKGWQSRLIVVSLEFRRV